MNSEYKLYSFDIFDTLITRKTATPKGIFSVMQQQLKEDVKFENIPYRIRNNFFYMRIEAEKVARNTYIDNNISDIKLEQIYSTIKLVEDISDEQISVLMELEKQTEYEYSIPIQKNIDRAKECYKEGKRVVLISNMYLDEKTIRRILVKHDDFFENVSIYVSSESGKTKGTKTLYHYVREKENVEYNEWIHIGDDILMDEDIPKQLGINVEKFAGYNLIEWEKQLLKDNEDNLSLQLLVGVAKNSRKVNNSDMSYIVGNAYAAVILYPYVEWVINSSVISNTEDLYFIARDGYVLKLIADIIITKRKLNIHTHYLYGSRKAWRLPSVSKDNFDMRDFLKWNYSGQITDFKQLTDIFGLKLDELKEFIPCIRNGNEEFDWRFRNNVFDILVENQGEISELICRNQKESKEKAIGYLRQELSENIERAAFVELIGSGYTQKCLYNLCEDFNKKPLTTFFYKIDNSRKSETNNNLCYYPNRLNMGNLIEVLCCVNHGQTIGYEYKNKWIPILGNDEGQMLNDYGFERYISGICDFTEVMSNSDIKKEYLWDLKISNLYFEYMEMRKSPELYDYIADMPFGIKGTDNVVETFAPKLTKKQLKDIYWLHEGENYSKFYSGSALEYSLKRLSEKQIKQVERYKKISKTKLGNYISKSKKETKNMIDCIEDFFEKEIILYGGGKRGQTVWKGIQTYNDRKKRNINVIMWADRNYQNIKNMDVEIENPENIFDKKFQQIVIAIADKKVANEIKEWLISKGVAKNKIIKC